ncbi:hypothetical protein V8E55_005733 [Tylopilus felleus]
MSMGAVSVLLFVIAALGDVNVLVTMDRTRRPRVDDPTPAVSSDDSNTSGPYIFARTDHTPLVDSLVPVASSSEPVTPSNHTQLITVVVVIVLVLSGLCTIVAMIFLLVRYFMRRAAVKRRRQVSWILRSGQWNMEPKRAHTYDTRTGFSDTSSFSAYPYPLSEHF